MFIPLLIKYIKDKGHSYEYIQNIKQKKQKLNEEKIINIQKDEIFMAEDIDKKTYDNLLKLQANNMATHKDKINIEKYCFKKHWNVNKIDKDMVDKFYGKNNVLSYCRLFSGTQTYEKIEFYEQKIIEKIDIVKNTLNIVGFDQVGDGTTLNKLQMESGVAKAIKKSQLFINKQKCSMLFNDDEMVRVMIVKNVKQFLGLMKSIIHKWGITIEVTKHNVRIKNKVVTNLTYKLEYKNGIDKYL